MGMSDRQTQPDLRWTEARGLLERCDRIGLPQQPRVQAAERHPVLRILRFDIQQRPGHGLGLLQASGRQQCVQQRPLQQRRVRTLPLGVSQQPLGIVCVADAEGECRQAAECRHMARINAQHLAKRFFGAAPIACEHGGSGFLDARALRIEQPRLFECKPGVGEQLQLHQQVAVCQPGIVQRGCFLDHASQQLPRRVEAPAAAIGTRQVDSR